MEASESSKLSGLICLDLVLKRTEMGKYSDSSLCSISDEILDLILGEKTLRKKVNYGSYIEFHTKDTHLKVWRHQSGGRIQVATISIQTRKALAPQISLRIIGICERAGFKVIDMRRVSLDFRI